jgi:5-methylcytosine-specific restriction endonuclease McrA
LKSGRNAKHFKCAKCKRDFPQKDVTVDHIIPVVGPEGFVSWDEFIKRLFCSTNNLQVVCIPCHATKTKKETLERKKLSDKIKTKKG